MLTGRLGVGRGVSSTCGRVAGIIFCFSLGALGFEEMLVDAGVAAAADLNTSVGVLAVTEI